MKKVILLLSLLVVIVVSGCASLNTVKTEITMPDGQTYAVRSKADALVKCKDNCKEMEVDNRGRPSFLETLLSGWIMRGNTKE